MHVSIVMPTYNRGYCIERAIRSVVSQRWRDWELVVVDDGSTDNTAEVCGRLKKEIGDRLDYTQVPNGGASAARNIGIFRSSGDYVAFLDSDDFYYPEKLSLQINVLSRQSDHSFCFSNWSTFYDDGVVCQTHHPMPASFSGNIYPSLLTVARNYIVTPSIVVRRKDLYRAGFFDTSMSMCEDIDMWRRLARLGRAIKIDTPLLGVHLRKGEAFPYFAGLVGRQVLYEKSYREDSDLSRDFMWHLYDEIVQCYLGVSRHRGDAAVQVALSNAGDILGQLKGGAVWELERAMATLIDNVKLAGTTPVGKIAA